MAAQILAGIASGLASAYMQQRLTRDNAQMDATNQATAQSRNFQYANDLQRNAPMNTKLGMVAAGLNPNAEGVTSSTGSMAPAPLGSHQAPTVNFSADNNLMADSRLKNAEAENLELKNNQIKGENESSYENYVSQLGSMVNLYKERGFTHQAESLQDELDNLSRLKDEGKLDWNVGNLRGAVNAFTTVDAMQDRLSKSLEKMVETETNYKMLVDGASVPLSQMSKLQRDLLKEQISNQIATNALLTSQKTLTDEQKNELVKLQEKMDNEINLLVEQKKLTENEANQIRNADWKSLMNDGEFLAAARANADEKTKIILQQAGSFANAVVNAKTGGKIANSIGNLKQTKGNDQRTTSTYHYDAKGRLKGHDVQQTSGKRSTLGRSVPNIEYDVTW